MGYLNKTQFAKRAGVSRTTIYNDLNTKLKKYVKTINGKSLISENALKLYKQEETQSKNKNELLVITETLQKQLEIKDEQIKKLQEELSQAQKNLQREQELHYQTREEIKLLNAPIQETSSDEIEISANKNQKKKTLKEKFLTLFSAE